MVCIQARVVQFQRGQKKFATYFSSLSRPAPYGPCLLHLLTRGVGTLAAPVNCRPKEAFPEPTQLRKKMSGKKKKKRIVKKFTVAKKPLKKKKHTCTGLLAQKSQTV